jgi:hypothetical protein
MQAKDIPDETILGIVMAANEGSLGSRIPGLPNYPRWCLIYDLEERLPSFPPKVILAKCRSLMKRRLMHGCGCGCRGDFYVCGSQWDCEYDHPERRLP